MNEIQTIALLAAVLLLVATIIALAIAGERGESITQTILYIIKAIPEGITANNSTQTTITETACNAPYILVNGECCTDANNNRVCDMQEGITTIHDTTSTTEPPSQTTTTAINCTLNSDCGEPREERICYNGNVYTQKINPICKNPGKPTSECIEKTALGEHPFEKCLNSCSEGECH